MALALPDSRSRSTALLAALVVAVLSGLFSAIQVGRPTPWGDEAVTLMTAGRPPSEILAVVHHVDAVHATYYLLVHYWQAVFGATVTADRFVSVVSVGVTTGLLVLLGRELRGLPTGVSAGLVFPVIPMVMWTSTEARSYALATAFVTAAVLSFTVAVRKDTFGWWAGYALLVAATAYVFLFAVLSFLALPLAVAVLPMAALTRLRWAGATALAGASALPLLLVVRSQSGQVSWIGLYETKELVKLVATQFFTSSQMPLWRVADMVAWMLVLVGIVALTIEARLRERNQNGRGRWDRRSLGTAALLTGWLFLPAAALGVGSHILSPMYVPRYVAMSTPAIALLVAIATSAATGLWRGRQVPALNTALALMLIWVVVSIPSWPGIHRPDSKSGVWTVAVLSLGEQKQPGDLLAVDPASSGLVHAQPEAMAGLKTINVARSFRETDNLGDTIVPLSAVTEELSKANRVWYVGSNVLGEDRAALKSAGFRQVWLAEERDGVVVLFERSVQD